MSIPRMLYQGALASARILVAPARLLRAESGAGFDAEYEERLGRRGAAGPLDVWIQAASVGEVLAAGRLIEELLHRRPNLAVALTTTTRTGRERADTLARTLPIATAYFPFDFRSAARAAIARMRPQLFVPFETEIWPNIWAETARSGARIAVVNGRLSPASFPRYRLILPLVRDTLALAARVATQSDEDAERFRRLGTPPGRICVTGNLKYDLAPAPGAESVARFAREIGLVPGAPLLVAGSTAEGEDGMLFEAFSAVLDSAPEARLLVAPRHPERFALAEAEAARAGVKAIRRSECAGGTPGTELAPGDAIILDTIGELRLAYGAASAAFVGGSLVPSGGQNPLEPAAAGLAPICGPHTWNFAEPAARLEEARALVRVGTAAELAAAFVNALRNPAAAREAGERARAAIAGGAGATGRTADLLLGLLDRPDPLDRPDLPNRPDLLNRPGGGSSATGDAR